MVPEWCQKLVEYSVDLQPYVVHSIRSGGETVWSTNPCYCLLLPPAEIRTIEYLPTSHTGRGWGMVVGRGGQRAKYAYDGREQYYAEDAFSHTIGHHKTWWA